MELGKNIYQVNCEWNTWICSKVTMNDETGEFNSGKLLRAL